MQSVITLKLNIGKIGKLNLRSIQHSAHLSCKYGHFVRGRGACSFLVGKILAFLITLSPCIDASYCCLHRVFFCFTLIIRIVEWFLRNEIVLYINRVLGKFLLRKFHLGKFHRENSSNGKFLLRCFGARLFRSWLASLAVGLRTLVSQVRAQRHSRIACYIVFP